MAQAMKTLKITKRMVVLSRWGVALLFLYSGALKAWDIQQFTYAVQNFQLTNWTGSIMVAVYLPWLEVVAALALLTKRFSLGAVSTLTTLTVIFLGAILSAWFRDLDVACGCFGSETNQTNYPLHLVGLLGLLAALCFLGWSSWRAGAPEELPRTNP